ncbi:MAG: hypothetical protein WAL56_11640 [Candidatus Sulfotelmatobacter sp.]
MRPATPLAAFLAAFVLLTGSVQLFAQHGGGHASGGGHGGFSGHSSFGGGGFGGHASAGHAFAGSHSGSSFAPRSFSGPRSFNRSLSSRSLNARNFNHSNNFRIRTYGFRNNCYGYRCGYGYGYPWLGAGIDPYWWWDSGSDDQDQQYQTGLANEMNAQSLDEQRMRQQGDQDSYARLTPPQHQPERTEAAPATVLVFRDQHKQEIQNYAIVGQTLWNFSPQHTEKIFLSDLDLPATTKANDDRGVSFRLPGSNEAQ